jgi:hypothetical protein
MQKRTWKRWTVVEVLSRTILRTNHNKVYRFMQEFYLLHHEIVKLRVSIRKVKENKFNYLRIEEAWEIDIKYH